MLKSWNHSTTTRNYAVTFYETLEDVPWHPGLIKLKNKYKHFQKDWKKIVKICINLRFLKSCCLSVASHRGGGGLHRGVWWGGGVQQGVGQQRGGGQ